VPVLRSDGIDDREQRNGSDEPRECHARARRDDLLRAAHKRADDSCEHGRNRERLLRRRIVERLVRRDLPNDENRDAVQRIEPTSGADAE
jgi:hypothetical protein